MSKFGVTPQKEADLIKEMKRFGLKEEDFLEKFIRSQGHGGQNVNKTATCVYLKHIPTGIEVKAQKSRRQGLNRFYARREMLEKFKEQSVGVKSKREIEAEKIRKQKDRRKRRAKKKIVKKI